MTQADSSGPAETHPRLTVTARGTGDGCQVVAVSGELDLDSAAALEDTLTRALRMDPPPRLLAVDLSALAFCDSTGLNLLLQVRRAAEERAVPLHLAGPPPAVSRLLEITGADTLFHIHERLDQALA
jgi:anti-anti-sigma factor